MSIVLAVFALLVTIGAGYLLIKGQKPVIVLLLAGFLMVAVSTALRPGFGVLEKDDSSGSRWLDIVGMFENVAGSQLTSVGLIIMSAGGFSTYMNKIGASRALVTFLTGSGVGAFSAFSSLVPNIAKGLGGSAPALITPMEFASGLFRSMSPVSGVVIAVAGGVGINPIDVVRRTVLPMVVGAVVMTTASLILL